MNNWKRSIRRFCAQQLGAEVSELAVVLAFIVAGSVALLIAIGPKIMQMYSDTNNAIP